MQFYILKNKKNMLNNSIIKILIFVIVVLWFIIGTWYFVDFTAQILWILNEAKQYLLVLPKEIVVILWLLVFIIISWIAFNFYN